MNMNKQDKASMLFMVFVFILLNGIALFFISMYTDIKFLKLAIVFLGIFALITIVKRIKNSIIQRKLKVEAEKRVEEDRKRKEEYRRIKEERKQLAIANQKARTNALRGYQKSGKKKGK